MTPAPTTVIAGNPVVVTLSDTIAPGSGVAAVDLTVTFDHSLLTLSSVADGTLLVGWAAPTYNPKNGLISISECATTCGSDAEGTGSIVSLTFTALAADPTTVTQLTAQTTPGPNANAPGEYQAKPTSANLGITAAAVTPPTTVPEPGTFALLLAPMLVAAGLQRRDRC